jgi:hypothetical protein
MTVIALTAGKGAPGVSTTALLLADAWPAVFPDRRVLLVEADPAGGDIAAGYLRGATDPARGLVGLAAVRPSEVATRLGGQLLALDEQQRRLLLPGLSDPAQAGALSGHWSALADALTGLSKQEPPIDVLLDLGRLGAAHPAGVLLGRADLAVLVLRPSLRGVAAARVAAATLRRARGDATIGALVVDCRGSYPAREAAEALGVDLLAVLPDDPAAAAVFSDGARPGLRFPRCALVRTARAAATAGAAAAGSAVRSDQTCEPVPSAQHRSATAPLTGAAPETGRG